MQVDTNEGVGENDELMKWLADNKLLKAKQQFIEYDVSMDDLKCIDIKNDLNDFVKSDLKLSGILASRAKKAIENLQQQQSYIAPPQPSPQKLVRVVLSQEEDNAINDINNKYNQVKTYLNTLNNNIKNLKKVSKENKTKINSMENEILNKIKNRMNELRDKSDKEINKKQQKIQLHINNVKNYEISLNKAQINHNKLLHDDTLDKTKRKIKIMKVNKNIKHENIMNNKPNFNAMVSIQFNKKQIDNFIQTLGNVNNNNYPNAPKCFVKNITDSSAVIEFREMASRLEHSIEINDYVCGNIVDNEDDEKGINWKELDVIKNKITYFCDNLKDNKTYKIRTRCRNEYGYSLYSKQISFTTKKLMIDSNILYNNEKQIFLGLMNSSLTDIGKTFKLIYRGSRDGWKSLDIHNKCDNKGKTVVLIYANTNNVFGAYRSIPWEKVSKWARQSDNNAFLFLIRSAKGYKPQIFKVKQSHISNAVWDYASNHRYMIGFGFGYGHDICVDSGCNANNYSYTSKTGYSYQLPNTEYYLNGCFNFTVKEIEVFTSE